MTPLSKEQAFDLIRAFALNQTEMTKRAATIKGISQKIITEERKLVINLLDAMLTELPPMGEINVLINSLS